MNPNFYKNCCIALFAWSLILGWWNMTLLKENKNITEISAMKDTLLIFADSINQLNIQKLKRDSSRLSHCDKVFDFYYLPKKK